jgi:RimJ/RimL family protein N-acetyltransferase
MMSSTLLDRPTDQLRTARLMLRPIREDDAARVFELFGQWGVIRTLRSAPWPYRPADAQAFCRERTVKSAGGAITFAIMHQGELIGVIDAVSNPAVQRGPGYTVGYWIGRPYWNKGFISEAARAFIAHVFATTGTGTIYSGVFKLNATSLRVQEKLGFVRGEEEMLFARPHDSELPFVNTVLTRTRFETLFGSPGDDMRPARRSA